MGILANLRAVTGNAAWSAIISLFLAISLPQPVYPCTLWAAVGKSVAGKGAILAKNRDNSRGLATELRYIKPEKGFPFIALFDIEADWYVVSGINEKGLAVVNASATSLTEEKRNVAKEDFTERILTTFDSVDAVIRERALLAGSHPAFYMLADGVKIANIEIAPGGKTSVKVLQDGYFVHANHYVDTALLSFNERKTPGSVKRHERINRLMAAHKFPFSTGQFIAFTEDRGVDKNDALMRPCNDESKKVCTLASWVVRVPEHGAPELYTKLAAAKKPDTVYRLRLDGFFWLEQLREDTP